MAKLLFLLNWQKLCQKYVIFQVKSVWRRLNTRTMTSDSLRDTVSKRTNKKATGRTLLLTNNIQKIFFYRRKMLTDIWKYLRRFFPLLLKAVRDALRGLWRLWNEWNRYLRRLKLPKFLWFHITEYWNTWMEGTTKEEPQVSKIARSAGWYFDKMKSWVNELWVKRCDDQYILFL